LTSEDEIDSLYRLPLAEFTAARNALAAQLRKQGARDEAARVAVLEKAAASAWTVNQIFWTARAGFDAWLAVAARLATAQRSGGPEAFRQAQRERRESLLSLMTRAEAILTGGGHAVTPATLKRISRTLEALAGRGAAPEGTTLGRLTADLEPPGFDAFAGLAIAPPAPPEAARPKPASPGQAVAEAKARREAIEQARDAVSNAEAEVRGKRKAVAEAAARADAARLHQQEAERVLHEAAQQARRATEAAEKAGFEARQTQTALAEAEREAEAAKAILDRRKREL
jgi:hypothetical protein